MPVISPTTASVVGSISVTRSPAEFDWMMMTFPVVAAFTPAPARTASNPIPNNAQGRRLEQANDIMDQASCSGSGEEERIFFDLADFDSGLADAGDMKAP